MSKYQETLNKLYSMVSDYLKENNIPVFYIPEFKDVTGKFIVTNHPDVLEKSAAVRELCKTPELLDMAREYIYPRIEMYSRKPGENVEAGQLSTLLHEAGHVKQFLENVEVEDEELFADYFVNFMVSLMSREDQEILHGFVEAFGVTAYKAC